MALLWVILRARMETIISSPFIACAEMKYGTRAITAIVMEESGEFCASESRFDLHRSTGSDVFHWEGGERGSDEAAKGASPQ